MNAFNPQRAAAAALLTQMSADGAIGQRGADPGGDAVTVLRALRDSGSIP